MIEFDIHPRLREDCHVLGRVRTSRLLLARNSAVPWFIIVPEVDCGELFEVDPPLRAEISATCDDVARFTKTHFGSEKINVAAIGNLVSQLHIHVIGRQRSDPCWPAPVWGNLPDAGDKYSQAALTSIRVALASQLGLVAFP